MMLFVSCRSFDQDFLVFRDFFLGLLFWEVFLVLFFAFLAGTFLPALRASERPMAIACFRLLTFLPERPLFNVPFFVLRTARATFFDAAFEYLRAMHSLRVWFGPT